MMAYKKKDFQKKSTEKNSLKLRPFGFLALSMGVALVTLLILDTSKSSQEFQPSVKVAKRDSSYKRKARGKKEFIEYASVNDEAKKPGPTSLPKGQKAETKIGSPDEAALAKALDSKLESAQDLVDTGEMESIMKAKEILEKILAEDPLHDGSIKELAMIHLYDLDEPVKAQELLQRSYNVNPEDPLVFSETLQLARENGMVNQFLDQVRTKVEGDPENPKLLTQMAKTLGSSGDNLRAGEFHAQAAARSNSSEEHYQAAMSFKKAGQKDLAIQHLELSKQVANNDPKYTESQRKTNAQLIDNQIANLRGAY